MKTTFSDPTVLQKALSNQAQVLQVHPPAIPFTPKKKKDNDEPKIQNIEIPLDPSGVDTTTIDRSVVIFEKGNEEDWIKWRIAFDALLADFPQNTNEKKRLMARHILRGEALAQFDKLWLEVEQELAKTTTRARASELETNKFDETLERMTLWYFGNDKNAFRRQRNYIRNHIYFNDSNFRAFRDRLVELNKYLAYFPVPKGMLTVAPLPDDELVEIIDRAKPMQYQVSMLGNNYDIYEHELSEVEKYIERLEASNRLSSALTKAAAKEINNSNKNKKKSNSSNKCAKRKRDDDDDSSVEVIPKCMLCGKLGHVRKE